MTEMDPVQVQRLRQGFKYLNKFMLSMWRVGLGKWLNIWPDVFGQIMVISHIGRKSGKRHRTPVNYAIVGGELYCTSGFGEASDWYQNMIKEPNVEVWLADGWWEGVAEDVTNHEQYVQLMRAVLIGSGFAAWLAGIMPKRMSDLDLMQKTHGYKLIHIRRTEARTGPGGPADLIWIWPVIAILSIFALLRNKRRN